jgi:processive 1,2-diacylglycerol beta-glucosyltransferase
MSTPRVLILTASFGDGHNSAARGLAEGLRREAGERVRVDVRDFIRENRPWAGGILEKVYGWLITHTPWVWRWLYYSPGLIPPESDPLQALQPVRSALAADLTRDPPAAIVCTFPLFPHLLNQLLGRWPIPVYSVVTDSISIHPIWRCDAVRAYFAADEVSAGLLRKWAGPETAVVETGFPVDPVFAESTNPHPAGDLPRRVLFFPAVNRAHFATSLRSLLRDGPSFLEITIVLGRHVQRLGGVVQDISVEYPDRTVSVLGWTRDVPRLMMSHDLIIAKAGGATTHETGAAGRPSILVKVVPGQEEGNVELVQRRGSGLLEEDPAALGSTIQQLVTSGAWGTMRDAAWKHRRPAGALIAARAILDDLESAAPPRL